MSKVSIKDIVKKIKLLSKELNKDADKITLTDLAKSGIAERQVRNNGGLSLIKAKYFPNTEKDLAQIEALKQDRNYVSKLEKDLGKKLLTEEQQIEILKKIINPVKVPKANIKNKKINLERDVVVMLTDTHFGLMVDPEEVGGLNIYNWEVACRRAAFLAKQVAEYKIEKRHEVKNLHVLLNGDHLHGIIHSTQDRVQDLLGMQQNGAMHIFTYFLGYVAQHYKNVIVHCNVGNHDQNVTRREGGRIITHASKDSFLTPVYYGLSLAFRNIKNVKFDISKGLYVDLNLPAGRAVAFHGDTIFSKQLGNTGNNINVKGLSDAINRWNTGETQTGRKKANLVIFGHTHTHAEFTTFDGVRVLVSPSMSGLDNYAYSLGINFNQAAQPIFESTKNHIFGDSRMVNVLPADKDKTLDSIIPTFKGNLNW